MAGRAQMFCLAGIVMVLELTSRVGGVIPPGCSALHDMAIIMDESESIKENDPFDKPDHNWNNCKRFIQSVMEDLPVGSDTRVAMVKFATTAEVIWHLNTYSSPYEMDMAVASLEHNGGNTNTSGALETAFQEVYLPTGRGNRRSVPNTIVLLTDGLSTVSKTQGRLQQVAGQLWRVGFYIYIVAIGEYIDEAELRSMVIDYSKYIIKVDDFDQLTFAKDLLVYRLCNLPDPPVGPPPDPDSCKGNFDLALVVDNSGSIGLENYKRLKDFLVQFVRQFDVNGISKRFGLVRFSDYALTEFPLGGYSNQSDLERRIFHMGYRDKATNTSGGIRHAVRYLFSGSPGDRPRVRNVMLLIADGQSNEETSRTSLEATRARRANIEIFVVGVTDKINYGELHEIANDPDERHFFDATDARYLGVLVREIRNSVCATED